MSQRSYYLLSAFAVCALAFSVLFTPSPVYAAEAVLDQFCENAEITEADSYWVINYHTGVGQTFKPTKDHLTSFSLALAGGADVTTAITAKLTQEGGGLVLTKTAATTSALVAWVDFSFPTVELDTTKVYRIELTTPSNTARWIVSTTPCYANGKAYVDGSGKDTQDFGFFTMGFTPPVDTPLVISKPTNLFGEYFSHDATNRISWKKSPTVGVEGYKIYRSKSASSGFALVSTTNAATLEYIDFTDIKPGKYYYYVIAFLGTTVSPSSGTITVTVPTPTTPTSTATASPTATATVTISPTVTELPVSPTPNVTRSVLNIIMKDYFPQALSVFALLLCGIIALVVLMRRPKVDVASTEVATTELENSEDQKPTEVETSTGKKVPTPAK